MKIKKNKKRNVFSKKIFILILAFVVIVMGVVLLLTSKYSADSSETVTQESSKVEVGVSIPGDKGGNSFTFSGYMCAVYRYALNIGFLLTWAMLIFAGYSYMTSGGNDAGIKTAKEVLISSLTGLTLLLLVKLVLSVLNVPYTCG